MSDLKIYIDFKSPAAYLAINPTLALAERLGLSLEWRGFLTNQSPVPERQPNEDKGQTHRRVRALAREAMHKHYAQVQSLPMTFRAQVGETDLALAVLEALPVDVRTAFLQACFSAYWDDKKDLNNQQHIEEILSSCAIEVDVNSVATTFDSTRDLITVPQDEDGVVDVPAYVMAGQLFIGREHLPWVEALCSGIDPALTSSKP